MKRELKREGRRRNKVTKQCKREQWCTNNNVFKKHYHLQNN